METKTQWEYAQIIQWRKQEIRLNGWNEFDVCARDFLKETGSPKEDLNACIEGMMRNMLEGDSFLIGNENDRREDLTVRYYCDNLSESRRKMFW